ncbi:insulinase family protein [Clostridium algidicarnis]|uniref:insulinase family protein n=1 Tax=Clostridium algidicarnis TaxID=37659 RepID=UPI003FD70F08
MPFKINDIYHGFKLIEEIKLEELNSIGRIFNHEKTGAKLINISNDDDNKVFTIGFKTPPENSTGVPHIIEHSVLAGSRKFKTKEPFVDLLKSSLNTFLNAMTFPDRTVYPLASKNEKDFINLLDVYMDGVFYPSIYENEYTFMQEGWHYILDENKDELRYNGVVYNEMKGAYSSPDSLAFDGVIRNLYKDTPYGHDSGGDPDNITELTYEDFLNFHKKYYHPSNSHMFLYGDVDVIKILQFINDNYLNNFDKLDIDVQIPIQEKFEQLVEKEGVYGISKDEDEKDKTYLALGYSAGDFSNPEEILALDILYDMILNNSAAPVKKALMDAGIGKSVDGGFENSIKQPLFLILIKGANEDKKDKFKKVLRESLQEIVDKGIDKDLALASINKREFALREADFGGYPKGLVYYYQVVESYMYNSDPFSQLQYNNLLENIKNGVDKRYFENLIEKYLLNNNHCLLYTLKPEKGYIEKKEKHIEEKLNIVKSQLTDNDRENIISKVRNLRAIQEKDDTEEQLNTIPNLSISDVNQDIEIIPFEERDEDGIKVLYSDLNTNKIAYLKLIFDAKVIPQELIQYGKLLSEVLGKISTNKYNYDTLINEISIHTGGIRFNLNNYMDSLDKDQYYPKFMVRSKALNTDIDKAMNLMLEILTSTKFEEKDLILQIIRENKSNHEAMIQSAGNAVAARRLLSSISQKAAYDEKVSGLEYYRFLCDLESNFENKWNELSLNLSKVSKLLFNKSNLIVSFAGEEEDYITFKNSMPIIGRSLKPESNLYKDYVFLNNKTNEGLTTQANIQYVAKGGNFKKDGFSYSGSLLVLQTIAKYDYLWNRVRVKGGAYGVSLDFGITGNLFISSYRDPNLVDTLKAYDDMAEYLRQFSASKRDMDKYIIGAVRDLDVPLTSSMRAERAIEMYFSKVTYDMIRKERQEVLSTTLEDIKSLSNLMESVMKQNYITVLGNEGNITKNKDLFDRVVSAM